MVRKSAGGPTLRQLAITTLALTQLAALPVDGKRSLQLVHPQDGEERTRPFVSLMWMPDRNGSATAYEIELNGTTIIVNGKLTLDTLLPAGEHHWRARSIGGAGEWSETWSFEILPSFTLPPLHPPLSAWLVPVLYRSRPDFFPRLWQRRVDRPRPPGSHRRPPG